MHFNTNCVQKEEGEQTLLEKRFSTACGHLQKAETRISVPSFNIDKNLEIV